MHRFVCPKVTARSLKMLEAARRSTLRRIGTECPARGPAFAALDVAIRRGTQSPGVGGTTWLRLERELKRSMCMACLRLRDERGTRVAAYCGGCEFCERRATCVNEFN